MRKGDELKVEWALRVFKEKKLFGITFKVQSNLIPSYGNTGINLGIYNGKHVALPIHDMFSDMNFGKISNEEAGGLDNSKLSRTNEAKTIKDKQSRNILERWEKFKSNSQ